MGIYVKNAENCEPICNIRFPDYTNMTKLSWSGYHKYTFIEDCYVCIVNVRSTTSGYGYELSINDVMLMHSSATAATDYQSLFILVSKGDILIANSYFKGEVQIISMK